MWRYVARRLAWAVVATGVVLTLAFALLAATPNASVAELQFRVAASGGNATAAGEAARNVRGLSGPVWRQYLAYMGNMATLDWGWSTARSQPVTTAIAQAWPYTVLYAAPALLLSTLAGLAIGLYSATHRNSVADHAGTLLAFLGLSVPNFWLGIVLLVLFATTLQWPVLFDPAAPLLSLRMAQQLFLPVVVLATGTMAAEARYSRAAALEYVHAEFVRTARAKGASERRVLLRHVLRPALVPLVTVLVTDLLGVVIASSYLVEVVFGVPGLGRLSYRAIQAHDTALVLGTTLIPAFVAIVGHLLQDLAYAALDPRIEYGERR